MYHDNDFFASIYDMMITNIMSTRRLYLVYSRYLLNDLVFKFRLRNIWRICRYISLLFKKYMWYDEGFCLYKFGFSILSYDAMAIRLLRFDMLSVMRHYFSVYDNIGKFLMSLINKQIISSLYNCIHNIYI